MEIDHLADVHPVNVIGPEHRDQVEPPALDEVDVLVDRVGGSPVPALAGPFLGRNRENEVIGKNGAEAPSLLQVFGQGLRFELRQDVEGVNPGIDEIAENKVDQPVFTPERNGGLGPFLGQGIEAAAFPPGQNHSKNIGWLHLHLRLDELLVKYSTEFPISEGK